MTREFRQCWAHSKDGHRCTLRAGHANDHVRKITWPDSDATPAAPTPVAQLPIPLPPPPTPSDNGKCVACHHRHADSECSCGCYSFVG